MIKDWVANYSDVGLTISGLFIFISVFTGAVLLTFSRSRREYYQHIERLPLSNEETSP